MHLLAFAPTPLGQSGLIGLRAKWIGLSEEFRDAETILEGSSDDEIAESPITTTFNTIYPSDDGILFGSRSLEVSLLALHPPTAHIFQLWQIFIENVHPVVMVFHAPSVQQEITEACGDLGRISNSLEVLLFAIYAVSMTSISHEKCERLFGEEKFSAIKKYQLATQQGLRNADYLRTTDLRVLQAFTLYLVSL